MMGRVGACDAWEKPILFHGTDEQTAKKIVQQGFNRNFSGLNATYCKDLDASCPVRSNLLVPTRSPQHPDVAHRLTRARDCITLSPMQTVKVCTPTRCPVLRVP